MFRNLIDGLLLVVSVWHATTTYIDDAGPNDLFINTLAAAQERGQRSTFWNFVAGAIDCYKCLSMWLTIVLLAIRAVSRPLFHLITVSLSVSATVLELDEAKNRKGSVSATIPDPQSIMSAWERAFGSSLTRQ
jgi:hypothetical protein